MQKIIHRIPLLLIYSRLVLGVIVLLMSMAHFEFYKIAAVIILLYSIISDIFDGIIARKINISNTSLRRLDSSIDQIFFICFIVATYIECPDFFIDNFIKLTILIGLEVLAYLISYIRFGKEVATHSIGAKFWALILVATLIQITLRCESNFLFDLCIYTGVLTRIEIIAIILILRQWTNDVPTFVHAIRLRQGKTIKRNKIFNG